MIIANLRHRDAAVQSKSSGRGGWRMNGWDELMALRWDWEKGDLVLLPTKPEGVVHQHFNLDPEKPAVWAALINMPIHEYLASDFQQVENSPDYKE
jgi:gentisate 1,2-dioxygenase